MQQRALIFAPLQLGSPAGHQTLHQAIEPLLRRLRAKVALVQLTEIGRGMNPAAQVRQADGLPFQQFVLEQYLGRIAGVALG